MADVAQVEVRPLAHADIDTFVVLRREALVREAAVFGGRPENDLALHPTFVRTQMDEGRGVLIGAFVDGALVGVVGAFRGDEPGEAKMWGLYVRREARGRGIGTDLVQAALTWAESLGLFRIRLRVRPRAKSARRLYEKQGFVRTGTRARGADELELSLREDAVKQA